MQIIEENCITNTIGLLLDQLSNIDIQNEISVFTAHTAPQITINNYLARLASYLKCSESCFVVGLIYLDRIIQAGIIKSINKLNVHSIIVGIKFLDDFYFSNTFYSKVGGICIKEFNKLEKEFLTMLDFQLSIDSQTYNLYLKKIEQIALLSQKQIYEADPSN